MMEDQTPAVGPSVWSRAQTAVATRVRATRWEVAVIIGLMIIGLGMRLWDLGGRSLHYDEILHAWYSWRFAEGLGYAHTPLTHGPLLFHGATATFALFGSSDFTARVLPALFGTALIGMPWLLRKELGRYGAMATAVLLMASPSILYFGRFLRNDIYMAVWALAMVIVMFRYIERPRTRLLVVWTALWALAYSTKESAYILAGMFGLYLLVVNVRPLWRWVAGRQKLSDLPPSGDLLIILGTLSLPLWAPAAGLFQDLAGITLVNPDPNNPRVVAGELFRAATETGAPVGGSLYIAAFFTAALAGVSIAIGLAWDKRRWPLLVALAAAIWLPLFTSMFTNWQGFFTGFWGSLAYWIAQQEVERAGQPWYYYLLGISIYEFLVFIPAILGSVFLAIRGTGFDRFAVVWAVGSLLAFSLAGERMPWLLVGITLPAAVVAGRTVGMLTETALGSHSWIPAFAPGVAVMFLGPLLVLRVLNADSIVNDPAFWGAIAGLVGVMVVTTLAVLRLTPDPATSLRDRIIDLSKRASVRSALAGASLGALLVLLGMTFVTGGRAAYAYEGLERPTELLVYSQTGQESTYTAECLDRLARESGLGNDGLRILSGEHDNYAWQWRWYLRNYANVQYQNLNDTPLTDSPDVDVVLISQAVEGQNRTQLSRDFTQVGELHHLWWFPNATYKGIVAGDLLRGVTSAESWRSVTDYFLSRGSAPTMYRSVGNVYVANDLAPMAEGCSDLRATTED